MINEKVAPDLLEYDAPLVASIEAQILHQVLSLISSSTFLPMTRQNLLFTSKDTTQAAQASITFNCHNFEHQPAVLCPAQLHVPAGRSDC